MASDSGPYHSFSYSALQPGEIRVLSIVTQEAKPIGSLTTIQLNDDTSLNAYDALSYAWGDCTETSQFECNGQILPVHKNLRAALPYLALRNSTRPIWIDAVCINQADEAEKMVQIRMMGDVYRRASKVWVWLGPPMDHTVQAIQLLPQIIRIGGELRLWHEQGTLQAKPSMDGLPPHNSPIWSAVYQLLDAPWYRRLWVVQEADLAADVVFLCGVYELPWELLEVSVEAALKISRLPKDQQPYDHQDLAYGALHIFVIRRRLQQKTNKSFGASELLTYTMHTRSHICTQPQDRVFALLGLASREDLDELIIGDGDISIADCYTLYVLFLLTKVSSAIDSWWTLISHGSLLCLERRSGLPTWCPDLHALERISGLSEIGVNYARKFQAGSHTDINNVRKGKRSGELILCGRFFDTIIKTFPEKPSIPVNLGEFESVMAFYHLSSWVLTIISTLSEMETSQASSPSNEGVNTGKSRWPEVTTEFWRILVGDITHAGNSILTAETFNEFWKECRIFMDRLEEFADEHLASTSDALHSASFGPEHPPDFHEFVASLITDTSFLNLESRAYSFLSQMNTILAGRQLFYTESGRFGFGTKGIRPKDTLCVIDAARTPHVLRRGAGEDAVEEVYELCGEAYVHGMMDGEIQTLGLQSRDITLV